jgi:hypothetical protein
VVRTETAWDPILNGYLLLRDTLVDGFDDQDVRIATGLLDGRRQNEIAVELGLHKSSISRRATSHGILAVVDANRLGTIPIADLS